MLTTTEKSEILYKALAREGDCWHTYAQAHWLTAPSFMTTCACKDVQKIRNGLVWDHECPNPNFFAPSTPDEAAINFMWLIDRIKDWKAKESTRFYQYIWGKYRTFKYALPERLISCTSLAEALWKYLELDKK